MPFEIVRNDITRMEVDAVVNPANPLPVIGAGTDAAIHAAAGPRLLQARQRIGAIEPGCCAATRAFDLPARYVLHAVTPSWQDGAHGEERLLRSAYDTALAQAEHLHCSSVAFPLLGAGSDGYPKERALSVAVQAFTDFLLSHELKVCLVVFNREAFVLAGSLFDGVKSYIDQNYVDLQAQKEYALPRPSSAAGSSVMAQRRAPAAAMRMDECGAPSFMPQQAEIPSDLHQLLAEQESSFADYLIDLLRESGEKDSTVYHRAQISRQLFHKILNKPGYVPSKTTVIQLAIGLKLGLAQTQKLLGKAGYCLTRNNKTDLVVQYYISRREFNLVLINLALDDCGLPPLKTVMG